MRGDIQPVIHSNPQSFSRFLFLNTVCSIWYINLRVLISFTCSIQKRKKVFAISILSRDPNHAKPAFRSPANISSVEQPLLPVTATPLSNSKKLLNPTRNTAIWCIYTSNLFTNPTLRSVTEKVRIHVPFPIWYCTISVYEWKCMGASYRLIESSYINISITVNQISCFLIQLRSSKVIFQKSILAASSCVTLL